MSFTQRLAYEALRSIDSSTFTGSYQALGSPLVNAASIVKVVNNSSALVTISIDGSTDHDILPGTSFFLYDVTANLPSSTNAVLMPAGTQYYVKGSSSTGYVYLVVQYIMQV